MEPKTLTISSSQPPLQLSHSPVLNQTQDLQVLSVAAELTVSLGAYIVSDRASCCGSELVLGLCCQCL